MLAQVLQGDPTGGHPAWHFGAVAAGAVGVFMAIKAWEWWGQRRPKDRQKPATRITRRPLPRPTGPIIALALASAGCAAIHAAVCPSHFRESAVFGVFFLIASASQAAWAVAILLRPSRKLLVAGAFGNAGIVAFWALTRTIGTPFGPDVWRPEAISTVDAVATQLEVGLALGAYWLLRGSSRSRLPVAPARMPAMLTD